MDFGVFGVTLFGLVLGSHLDFDEPGWPSSGASSGRVVLMLTAAWAQDPSWDPTPVTESTTLNGYQVQIDSLLAGNLQSQNDWAALAILVEWHLPDYTKLSKVMKALVVRLCAVAVTFAFGHVIRSRWGLRFCSLFTFKTFLSPVPVDCACAVIGDNVF